MLEDVAGFKEMYAANGMLVITVPWLVVLHFSRKSVKMEIQKINESCSSCLDKSYFNILFPHIMSSNAVLTQRTIGV